MSERGACLHLGISLRRNRPLLPTRKFWDTSSRRQAFFYVAMVACCRRPAAAYRPGGGCCGLAGWRVGGLADRKSKCTAVGPACRALTPSPPFFLGPSDRGARGTGEGRPGWLHSPAINSARKRKRRKRKSGRGPESLTRRRNDPSDGRQKQGHGPCWT